MEVALEILIEMLVTAFFLALTSLTSAWALLKGLKPRQVVGVGAFTMALFLSAVSVLTLTDKKNEAGFTFQGAFEQAWAPQVVMMQKMKFTPQDIDLARETFQKYVFFSWPAWLAVGCLLAGLISYYLVSVFLSRITPRVKPMAFQLWVVPDSLVFGLITA